MIVIRYTPTFIRMYKNLDMHLKEEIKEKISLFQDSKNHIKLKIHKLKGKLDGKHAFSVNYKIRVVFTYKNESVVNMLYVGSHNEVYD